MSKRIIKIKQGITFSGNIFWVGIIGLILALVLLIFKVSFIIPAILAFISMQLILSIKIIEIDKKNNIFRYVVYLFPFKIGEWELISDYKKMVLAPDHYAAKAVSLNNPFIQKSSSIRNYDVYLQHEKGKDKNLVLFTSKSIKESQKKLILYSKEFNIEADDKIKQTWQKYHKKRHRKRNKILT